MTDELKAKLEDVLKSRDQKVQRLYGKHAIKVLKVAENLFIKYPTRDIIAVKVPRTNRIFLAYLRMVATSDKWNFFVLDKSLLRLILTRRVWIYREGCSNQTKTDIKNAYHHVLCEKMR